MHSENIPFLHHTSLTVLFINAILTTRRFGDRNRTEEHGAMRKNNRGGPVDIGEKKLNNKEEKEEKRKRRGELTKRGDWVGKRGEMREQRRREEEKADWIFQR